MPVWARLAMVESVTSREVAMNAHNPRAVVVAVGHDRYDSALRFAAAEATRAGCGLHLVHAVESAAEGVGQEADLMQQLNLSDVERLGQRALTEAVQRARELLPEDAPLTTELVHGAAVWSVVEAAAEARLLVVQRHNTSMVARIATRSASRAVAAHCHVPVVSVPTDPDDRPPRKALPVVTVGVAVPEHSRAVLQAAAREARDRGATLHVLHTWWFPSPYDEIVRKRKRNDVWTKRTRAELRAALRLIDGDLASVPVELDLRQAHPARALVEASQMAELVVVGRHDPLLPIGSRLGRVARTVLREAECAVLVTAPREHRRPQRRGSTRRPAVSA